MQEERFDWDRVEHWLERRGMSKAELAQHLGMTRDGLYKIRSGDVPFSRRNAMAIAFALDITLDDLIVEEAAVG